MLLRRLILLVGLALALVILSAQAQFVQQGPKLVGTGAVAANADQGVSVSISRDGNTAIVGGGVDEASWIFTRSNGVWSQQGSKLVGTGGAGFTAQGYSVALSGDGNTAIAGGWYDNALTGAAWIFTRANGVWSQQGSKLVGTGAIHGVVGSQQGRSIALSGDGNTAIMGGDTDNAGVGAAWIFTRSNGVWSQQGSKLVGTDAVGSASQGHSVSLSGDGNTAIIGGAKDNGGVGAAWIFTRSNAVWSQQGSKLVGTGAVGGANQGYSVALSGDGSTAIMGAVEDSSELGAAWMFTRSNGVWNQQGSKLVGTGAVGTALQGWSVALSGDGNTALVGGENDNNGAGAAWIFTRTNGIWSQQGSKLVGTGAVGSASQGWSVALSADGSTAIVGGPDDKNSAGAAWVFAAPTSTTSAALKVSSTHVGNFVQGQPSAVYTISVQNSGAAATSGAVSVADTLPAGLTATAMNGPGWVCTLATLTCSRSDALAAGGTYPPITLTVSVASNAALPVTNQVSASGGGSATATASDSSTIVPAFTDIPPSDLSFIPYIDLLQQSGITKGCQDSPPMYCSTAPIPESQMAVFVIRSVIGSDNFAYTLAPYFTDVPATNLYFPWIQKMQDLGIAQPCAQTLYCPDSAVTRGIMSVLIIRSRLGVATPTNYPTTPYFTDVPPTHPYFSWIQKMKQLGITSGCTPTTYCPDLPVTRGQMAVFIMRGEFNQGLQDPNTPVLAWVNPASASPGQTVTVTIVGQNTNFSSATQVNGGPGITVSNVNGTNGTTLTAQLTVAGSAVLGPRSITVTTGSEEATLPNGFRVQ